MKTFTFLLLAWFSLLCGTGTAQDIIYKTSGEEIPAKVVEITPVKIMYMQPAVFGDSVLSFLRKDVFMVKYANGQKELMQPAQEEAMAGPENTPTAMFRQGQIDAQRYYKGTNAMWGSAAITFATGITGTIIVAAIPPKINPAEVPNPALLANPYYTKGYKSKAHSRKVGKAAIGGGIGIVALAALLSTLSGGK